MNRLVNINRINRNLLIIPLIIFLFFLPVMGQDGDGGTEDNMSILGYGARPLGMGKAFTALADDPTAVYWNPAGLEFLNQQSATFFHSSLWGGTSYDFLGYAYPTLNLGTFGLGIARIGIDDIPQTSADEQEYGNTFSNTEYQIYVSYAKKLPYNLTPGISLRMFQRSWSGLIGESDLNDTGYGIDLGLMYRPEWLGSPWLQDWSFGMKIQNFLAPQIKEGNVSENFPLTLKLGVFKKVRFAGGEFFSALFDLDYSEYRSLKVHLGTEYRVRNYGELRIGYTTGGLTFGASVEYQKFRFDYSYGTTAYSEVLPGVHRFSLSFTFGHTREELYEIAKKERKEEQNQMLARLREEENQQFIAYHLIIGELFFAQERYLDAIVEYQQVLSRDLTETTSAAAMIDSANTLLEKGFSEAQALAVKDALDKNRAAWDRQFIDSHFEKGRTLLDQNEFNQALVEFNLILERDSSNMMLINAIETTNRRIDEEARRLLELSKEELNNQNYSEALVLLADARSMAGVDTGLVREINAVTKQIDFQRNIQKGILLFQVEEYSRALAVFEELLAKEPDNEIAKEYCRRSKIEITGKDVKMAQQTKKRYMEGMTYYLSGKYVQAIEIWEEILVDQPYNKRVNKAIQGAKEKMAQGTE